MAEIGDNARAVAAGLAQTASVITGAAAIMVSVFAAFTLVRLREVQELGFSLSAAVFLDATLVRLILVPATMELLGHWNWWFPRWLNRVVPSLAHVPAMGSTSRAKDGTAEEIVERATAGQVLPVNLAGGPTRLDERLLTPPSRSTSGDSEGVR